MFCVHCGKVIPVSTDEEKQNWGIKFMGAYCCSEEHKQDYQRIYSQKISDKLKEDRLNHTGLFDVGSPAFTSFHRVDDGNGRVTPSWMKLKLPQTADKTQYKKPVYYSSNPNAVGIERGKRLLTNQDMAVLFNISTSHLRKIVKESGYVIPNNGKPFATGDIVLAVNRRMVQSKQFEIEELIDKLNVMNVAFRNVPTVRGEEN